MRPRVGQRSLAVKVEHHEKARAERHRLAEQSVAAAGQSHRARAAHAAREEELHTAHMLQFRPPKQLGTRAIHGVVLKDDRGAAPPAELLSKPS
jgi:hypothetical protein